MQSTHVGLYSYLPLSLNGPKGEGDQGGEGSPVGLGRCPPKCDINPLTLHLNIRANIPTVRTPT